MSSKIWQEYSLVFKDLLGLEYSPVGLSCLKQPLLKPYDKKKRICRAILEAGKGEASQLSRQTNACLGGAWHLGLSRIEDKNSLNLIRKFVVEGEKLFCSYQALDNLISQMDEAPDNRDSYFVLDSLERCQFKPELVIFICDAQAACRLLTLIIYVDGAMPKIKIGGPTCAMAVIYPLLKNEVNLSFYDYSARKICNVPSDKLLLSLPYSKIPAMVDSIDKCSAGRASIEYPQGFRELMQAMCRAAAGTDCC